ncbi:hypothetical protein GS907_27055, partial [Rhodococcus hoagii]|nr:hypothetical protein [Prescottella equi]
ITLDALRSSVRQHRLDDPGPHAGHLFHKRSDEDSRIDWTWPADAIERLVRAQSTRTPTRSQVQGSADPGTEVVGSQGNYGGTPGRVFIHEGDGMVIVAGPDARTGTNKGLVIERVRLDDGPRCRARSSSRTEAGTGALSRRNASARNPSSVPPALHDTPSRLRYVSSRGVRRGRVLALYRRSSRT